MIQGGNNFIEVYVDPAHNGEVSRASTGLAGWFLLVVLGPSDVSPETDRRYERRQGDLLAACHHFPGKEGKDPR